MTKTSTFRSDLILLLAATIWGFAFVAQRMGMEDMGPFLFNGIRFALGAGVLVIVVKFRDRFSRKEIGRKTLDGLQGKSWRPEISGIPLGLILFAGASFQQVGIVYTTAGNAGFITGLYIILVPAFGLVSGQKASWGLWSGAILGLAGLYILSVTANLSLQKGDLLVLISAVFWAVHVLYTGWLAPRHSALRLAIAQYMVCSLLSFLVSMIFESNSLTGVINAIWPLLYGGILSVGIAYTLQIVGQKKAPPAHTAIILSLEAVFAVIGGMIVLSEPMSGRKWLGCSLMLAGMIIAQVKNR